MNHTTRPLVLFSPRTIAALLFACVFLEPAALAAGAHRNAATGIEFPESVAGYQRGAVMPYGEGTGEPGEAIAFRSSDTEVTVYVRKLPAGSKKSAADFLAESLQAIKSLGAFSDLKVFELNGDKEPPNWKTAAVSGRIDRQFRVSFISCAIHGEHLVKIRATTANPTNDPLQVFLKEIRRIIDSAKKS